MEKTGRRRRSKSNRKEARTDAVDGSSGGDRITALPLELRARIVSLLHYRQIVQLSVLSRPWRHIHHHTPVVKIYLYDFLLLEDIYFDEVHSVPGILDEQSILAARVALARRAQDASASAVDSLRLAYVVDDRRMRRHADRIIALARARDIRIQAPYREGPVRDAWVLDLPPPARDLEVEARDHLAPAITGPGAAALRNLCLKKVVIREWPPHLPALLSLDLSEVTVEAQAPFAPGAWCPRLEELDMFNSKIEHARVDIHLPLLRFMSLVDVDVSPHSRSPGSPFGEIAVDAPELLELDVDSFHGSADYKSFSLRAPKLRVLGWCNQFAERVAIDVGRPGSVKVGEIQLRSIYSREMDDFREQMMRMLEGLLPDLPRESIADVARPYMTQCDDSDDDDEDEPKIQKLTCDINGLMLSI